MIYYYCVTGEKSAYTKIPIWDWKTGAEHMKMVRSMTPFPRGYAHLQRPSLKAPAKVSSMAATLTLTGENCSEYSSHRIPLPISPPTSDAYIFPASHCPKYHPSSILEAKVHRVKSNQSYIVYQKTKNSFKGTPYFLLIMKESLNKEGDKFKPQPYLIITWPWKTNTPVTVVPSTIPTLEVLWGLSTGKGLWYCA